MKWTTLVILFGGLILCGCSEEPDKFFDPPSGPGTMAPNLALTQEGVLLTWLQPAASGFALYQAELRGETWTTPQEIASGDGFFANWADVPAAVETAEGTRFAHWLGKIGEGTYAYGAELARSRDGGASWERLGLLHDDASPTEHGFVSYVPLADGGAQAFWLDGREMIHEGGSMHLRSSRLGESVSESVLLDGRVCECCSTAAALSEQGPIVAYRDRGPTEVRDIAVVRALEEGWSEPLVIAADGWEIHGCPVNGPAIAAEGSRVAVAWFTMGEPGARVSVAFSSDAGASFSAPIVVDDVEPLGRVGIALDSAGALVSWMSKVGEEAEIRWRRVTPSGDSGPVRVVATTSAARSAGIPRLLRRGDDLFIAWVETGEPSKLRVGRVSIEG